MREQNFDLFLCSFSTIPIIIQKRSSDISNVNMQLYGVKRMLDYDM